MALMRKSRILDFLQRASVGERKQKKEIRTMVSELRAERGTLSVGGDGFGTRYMYQGIESVLKHACVLDEVTCVNK